MNSLKYYEINSLDTIYVVLSVVEACESAIEELLNFLTIYEQLKFITIRTKFNGNIYLSHDKKLEFKIGSFNGRRISKYKAFEMLKNDNIEERYQ